MPERCEVAIVGAGPAGISAACILADHGVQTVVLERGEFPGAKNISGGVLYGHDLARILPDFAEQGCPVERNIVESRIWYASNEGGYSLSYRDRIFEEEKRHNVFSVARARFDRWFADQAGRKGALIVCSTVVTDLLRDEKGRVRGVRTDRPEGDLEADVVLLADGINSPLAAQTGFRPEPDPGHVALAVKEIIELSEETVNERFNVSQGDGVTIEILGGVTQGMNGVGALYTNKKSLSLVIGGNLQDFADLKLKPYELMESFKGHPMVKPLIRDGEPREYMAHWLPEAGYEHLPKLCGDGFLIAGDSGFLFNALHREGSNMAMVSGELAARTILEARQAGDFSRAKLEDYPGRLEDSFILKDLKKYRRFPGFLQKHKELFTVVPELSRMAGREMLSVDGVPKKAKQQAIWKRIKRQLSVIGLLRLLFAGIRSVK
ncbi:MAG: FAD-dependent oxidoreductase [Desulfohalobiaceae bacterium]|nr:FAD-dependent oxidoreductase [Desulfohalobiaceae bacterium]